MPELVKVAEEGPGWEPEISGRCQPRSRGSGPVLEPLWLPESLALVLTNIT